MSEANASKNAKRKRVFPVDIQIWGILFDGSALS